MKSYSDNIPSSNQINAHHESTATQITSLRSLLIATLVLSVVTLISVIGFEGYMYYSISQLNHTHVEDVKIAPVAGPVV